ncbi:MAG: O-methyltransferase [Mucilaginibacter sp.]
MLNFTFAKDYLLHRLKGKTRHGTHSPFVYRLVDEVIYDFSQKKVYDEVENLRPELLSDERLTAKSALTQRKLARLLYRLVADLQPKNMIELGADLGITSLYLQKAAPEAQLYTKEGGSENLPGMINGLDKLDFVFVSGHNKETALSYFEWCLPKVHENTLLIFDDIYRNEGMKEAWKKIKAHPKVTVTIDLFWLGLVYFRKGQVREDFVIKI